MFLLFLVTLGAVHGSLLVLAIITRQAASNQEVPA